MASKKCGCAASDACDTKDWSLQKVALMLLYRQLPCQSLVSGQITSESRHNTALGNIPLQDVAISHDRLSQVSHVTWLVFVPTVRPDLAE